jgi:isoleucyl-tRNA synthetase
VSDRIALTVGVPEDVRGRLGPHEAFIAGETLATTVAWGQPADGTPLTLGGAPVSVEVERAAS